MAEVVQPVVGANGNGLNSVHYLGVTEEEGFAIRWDVRNFRERLNLKFPHNELKSPMFNLGDDRNPFQWQVTIFWNNRSLLIDSDEKVPYLSVYLDTTDMVKGPEVTYQFDLIDCKGKCWRTIALRNKFAATSAYGVPTFAKLSELLNPANNLLGDNTLKLICRITLNRDSINLLKGVKTGAERESLKRKFDLVSDFSNLFNSEKFSDVLIQTKEDAIRAHKSVLSCRSPVFQAMFETEMSESITNTVNIIDFSDDIVKGMLEYIYCAEICKKLLEEKPGELLQIADKYDIRGLKQEAEDVIAVNLTVENVADVLVLADRSNALNLKEKAVKFFNVKRVEVVKTAGFRQLATHDSSVFKDLYCSLLMNTTCDCY